MPSNKYAFGKIALGELAELSTQATSFDNTAPKSKVVSRIVLVRYWFDQVRILYQHKLPNTFWSLPDMEMPKWVVGVTIRQYREVLLSIGMYAPVQLMYLTSPQNLAKQEKVRVKQQTLLNIGWESAASVLDPVVE